MCFSLPPSLPLLPLPGCFLLSLTLSPLSQFLSFSLLTCYHQPYSPFLSIPYLSLPLNSFSLPPSLRNSVFWTVPPPSLSLSFSSLPSVSLNGDWDGTSRGYIFPACSVWLGPSLVWSAGCGLERRTSKIRKGCQEIHKFEKKGKRSLSLCKPISLLKRTVVRV